MRRRGHGGGDDGDGGAEAEASSPTSPAKFKRTVSFGPDDTDEGRDGAAWSLQSHVGRRGSIQPPPILAAAESPFPLGLNTIHVPPRSLIQHVVGCYSCAYALSLPNRLSAAFFPHFVFALFALLLQSRRSTRLQSILPWSSNPLLEGRDIPACRCCRLTACLLSPPRMTGMPCKKNWRPGLRLRKPFIPACFTACLPFERVPCADHFRGQQPYRSHRERHCSCEIAPRL
jgi:hypothetical protein